MTTMATTTATTTTTTSAPHSIMTEQLTGTLCAYLLAIPTIALAAHRGLQRWQVVRMLTPPPVPVCERTWWKKVVKIVAFIIVYGAFLWILTLRSWIVEKVVWTALLAFYTGGSAYQWITSFVLPTEVALTRTGDGKVAFSSTSFKTSSHWARYGCLVFSIGAMVTFHLRSEVMFPLWISMFLGQSLLAFLPTWSIRWTISVPAGMIGFSIALASILPSILPSSSGAPGDAYLPPRESIVFADLFTTTGFLTFSSVILPLNLRFDYRTDEAPEMLAAGKAASMPPLLPLTNLFAAPIFRVSFLALIVTHIVTFFVCYSIGQSDVAAVLALTICTLVVPAVSALQAYIRGELAAWWSYKEVWIPQDPKKTTDVEQGAEAPSVVEFADDKKPILADAE